MRKISVEIIVTAILVLVVAVLAFGATSSNADEADVALVIEGRQSNLRDVGAAFKGINDELKKSQPSLPLIRQYAAQIEDLSKQQRFWFPSGSGPESEIETKAKPSIWAQPKDFVAAQNAMTEQAAKMVTVAGGTDVAAIKAQRMALGKTCKDCHDSFREEDE